jgi:hypothetical protein
MALCGCHDTHAGSIFIVWPIRLVARQVVDQRRHAGRQKHEGGRDDGSDDRKSSHGYFHVPFGGVGGELGTDAHASIELTAGGRKGNVTRGPAAASASQFARCDAAKGIGRAGWFILSFGRDSIC